MKHFDSHHCFKNNISIQVTVEQKGPSEEPRHDDEHQELEKVPVVVNKISSRNKITEVRRLTLTRIGEHSLIEAD